MLAKSSFILAQGVMVKAKVFIYSKKFEDGPASNSNFQLIEEELPDLKDGGESFD